MKKKTLIILIILLALIAIGMILFILLNRPETALRRKYGIVLPENAEIANYSCSFSGLTIDHDYEIVFNSLSFDEIMDKYLYKCGDKQQTDDIEMIKSIASSEASGVPFGKHWLDVNEETIVWWHEKSKISRTVVTQDGDGRYHAYISWFWDPQVER